MARLQHTQIKTYQGKVKADDTSQRNSLASDRHAFENALKVASIEKSEKVDSTTGLPGTSAFEFNSDEQDDWHRYTNSSVVAASAFQSTQYSDPNYVENRIHPVRDFPDKQNCDAAICATTLDELSDWLDDTIGRDGDSAGGWTFEFETDDAQLVELQLVCQQDGQWSACINLDTTVDDQQELELMLSKKGVALSWMDIS